MIIGYNYSIFAKFTNDIIKTHTLAIATLSFGDHIKTSAYRNTAVQPVADKH